MVSLQKTGFEAKNASGVCNKFWRGWVTGSVFHANWGAIGTTGQSKEWDCGSSYEADKKLQEKVREKLGKSYVMITRGRLVEAPTTRIVNYVMDETEIDNLS